jgi:hypothetical protein
MERRAISELISDTKARLHDTRSRVAEQHTAIERRRAIGAELTGSLGLLDNLETIVRLRERPALVKQLGICQTTLVSVVSAAASSILCALDVSDGGTLTATVAKVT